MNVVAGIVNVAVATAEPGRQDNHLHDEREDRQLAASRNGEWRRRVEKG
jgi:hypothetical protein